MERMCQRSWLTGSDNLSASWYARPRKPGAPSIAPTLVQPPREPAHTILTVRFRHSVTGGGPRGFFRSTRRKRKMAGLLIRFVIGACLTIPPIIQLWTCGRHTRNRLGKDGNPSPLTYL